MSLGTVRQTDVVQAIGTAPSLGTAANFAVLGGQAVTNTGPTIVSGSLGVSPGSAVTGFPPGVVVGGVIHAADAVALQAQSDTTVAYNNLAGQACDTDLTGQNLGGMTLGPGVYCFSSSAFLTGTLTLDGEGDPDAVFIFQIGSTLITAPGSTVVMINGAQDCNVFWQVGSSATLDTTTTFIGNILALTTISMNTGATLSGRALARNGSVTLDSNVITQSTCDVPGAPDVDLELTKTDSPDPVIAGQNITYVLTVTNNGTDPASNVSITDNLPVGTVFVSATPSAGGVCELLPGNIVRCVWAGDTAPGESRSVTIVVRVCPEQDCGTTLTNTAVADAETDTLFGITSLTVPQLSASRGATNPSRGGIAPDAPHQGGSVLYSIDADTGTASPIGAGVGFSSCSGLEIDSDGTFYAACLDGDFEPVLISIDPSAGTGTEIGPLNYAAGSRTPDVSLRSDGVLFGYSNFDVLHTVNKLTGASTALGPSSSTNCCGNGMGFSSAFPDVLYLAGETALETLNQTTGASAVVDSITYPAALEGRINAMDVRPSNGSMFVSVNVGGGGDLNRLNAPTQFANYIGTIDLASAVVTFIGSTVSRLDGIAWLATEDAVAVATTTAVQAQANLTLDKTGPATVIAGNTATYSVLVTNLGPSNSVGTTVVDTLPAGTTFISATSANLGAGVCSHAGGVVTCNLGTLGAPAQCAVPPLPTSDTITIMVRVCADTLCGTVLTNSAQATSTNCLPDPTPLDAADTVQTTVQTQSNLGITKTQTSPAGGVVVAGQNVTYSIVVTNSGPSSSVSTIVSDILPASLRFVSATPSQGSCSAVGQTVTCNLGTLGAPSFQCAVPPSPTSATITLVVRACPEAACGGVISNTATVSGGNLACASRLPDPTPANNTSTANTTVQARADLSITKTGTPNPVIAGQNLTYQLVVTNAGPSNSPNTVVVDTLPVQTTFVSATPSQGTCSHLSGVVTCSVGTLGPVGILQCTTGVPFPTQVTIAIVVQVRPDTPSSDPTCGCNGAALVNEATVSGGTPNCGSQLADPTPANNAATISTQVRGGADVLVEQPIIDGPECFTSGDILTITQSFSNTGPCAVTSQPDGPGPEFVVNLPGSVVGLPGTCTVLQGGGTCVVTATQVTWNGEIPVGATIILEYRVRIRGGLPFGTEICFPAQVIFDECNVPASGQRSAVTCALIDCAPTVNPNSPLSGQVHLPIMNFQGQNDVCRTWIEIQNVGAEFSKAALVVWGEPGFCPPQCSGPLKVECSGLLKPGSSWNFIYPQVPNGAKSGILFSFTARQLSQIGDPLGFDDIVADVLCETLFFNVVGDCDDYRRFKKAYNEGLVFAGIPLDRAIGSPLAVEVLRNCPGDATPGAEVSSKYGGIAGIDLGAYDPVFGGYAYYVPLLYAESSDLNSVMYIQNGGIECSSVEIWFKAQDDCLRARICEIFTLAPGETYQFDSNDCVGPDFQGNAWLRSSQPMGIAVDIFGRDIMMTYTGVPTELNYTFNPDEALFTTGNQVAYGPLIYSEYQGWDSGVQVQNMSSVFAAKVKVYFLDRSGDVISTLVDWVCPRGSQTFFLPVVANLPGSWVGSLRVESQEWFSPGDPLVAPPNITGIVTLIRYTDAARSDTAEAIAYNLLTEQRAYDWQLGCCAGGTESGIGLIAIPSLIKDLDNTGVTTEIAIANLVPKPGFTDFAIYIYDQNGLIDYVCQKLNEKQVEYINLDTWGYVHPGFKGSAIISATFWEHDVFDETGFFLRNLLGLAAVSVERTGAALGGDIPGDEAAGTTGIPFRQVDTEEDQFFFDFEGPVAPRCPGQPGVRPDPFACPAALSVPCQDCPMPILDLQTISSFIDITAQQVPAACEIADVNLLLNISHTFNNDLVVDLSGPDLADVVMFSRICGADDNIQVVLDDDGAQPIGSVCPPAGFQTYNTAPPGNLTLFEGLSANGVWKLDIQDAVGADTGTLNTWELQFEFGN